MGPDAQATPTLRSLPNAGPLPLHPSGEEGAEGELTIDNRQSEIDNPPVTAAPTHTHHARATSMLRVREPGEHSPVTTFELFFDLVFVFAVTQLSHTLAGHLDGEGLFHTTLMTLAVWWVWVYTTWATNWCDPNHLGVRIALIGIMFGSLVMAAAIPHAFNSRGLAFALPLLLIQVLRTGFVVYATRQDPVLKRNFERIVIWLAIAACFWFGGALVEGSARAAFWVIALAIEYAGPPAAFWVPGMGRSATSDWTIEGSHFAERCGLFVIIALGESLLITGATFSHLEWTAATTTAMVAAFLTAVAMWWLYFDVVADAGAELIAHSDDPGRIARLAYTYVHIPIVAGIILTAVGDELVLAHPRGDTELSTALTVVGGPAVFLAGYVLFKAAILGRFFAIHAVVLVALGALLVASSTLSPVALTVGSTVVLVALAARGRLANREALVTLPTTQRQTS
jgi:low temperature requirement protein LtrA